MIDTYTKVILTVIAISLSAIAAKGTVFSPAKAVGSDCGVLEQLPCYTSIVGTVSVTNEYINGTEYPLKVSSE